MNFINYKTPISLYFFLLIHLTVWTIIPSITNQNLPLDTIEALAWGSNLDWDLINIHWQVPFLEVFSF